MFTFARGLYNLFLLKTISSRSFNWIYRQFNPPWDYSFRKKASFEQTVMFLNQLLKDDPEAIQKLVDFRVPCNDKIAHHPTVKVRIKDDGPMVGIMGILNGLFGKDKDGMSQIIAEYDQAEGKLKQFWTREDWSIRFQLERLESIKDCEEKVNSK